MCHESSTNTLTSDLQTTRWGEWIVVDTVFPDQPLRSSRLLTGSPILCLHFRTGMGDGTERVVKTQSQPEPSQVPQNFGLDFSRTSRNRLHTSFVPDGRGWTEEGRGPEILLDTTVRCPSTPPRTRELSLTGGGNSRVPSGAGGGDPGRSEWETRP